MFVVKLLPLFVRNLSGPKWSDNEIVEVVQYLKDELSAHFGNLTTYDEYMSELSSGHLWSPVHNSETFWQENAVRLNEKDYEQLKTLVTLMNDSKDPLVLAVAAHDVGQYVKHCDWDSNSPCSFSLNLHQPKLTEDHGAKRRVMELLLKPSIG